MRLANQIQVIFLGCRLMLKTTFFRLPAKLNPREIFWEGLNSEIKSMRNQKLNLVGQKTIAFAIG